jgi:arylsulfatase
VILAQGGREHGYALHVSGGRVHFTVRRDGKAETIAVAREGEDFAVTARLGAGGAMELQVGSGPVVRGRAGGLIAVQPKDGLSVGEDAGSAVGDYAVPFPLKAKISEVSVKAGEE